MSNITKQRKQRTFTSLMNSDTVEANTLEINLTDSNVSSEKVLNLNLESKHTIISFRTSEVETKVTLENASLKDRTLHTLYITNTNSVDITIRFDSTYFNILTLNSELNLVDNKKYYNVKISKTSTVGFVGSVVKGKLFMLPGYVGV